MSVEIPAKSVENKDKRSWYKVRASFLWLLAALLLFVFPPKHIVVIDDMADSYFESTIVRASTAYAYVRLINAGVSIVKESTLQLEPGGIGIEVAVGQFADPLDDMTERLSNVLVTAIVSLMIQEIAYEISQVSVFALIGGLFVVIAVLSVFKGGILLSYRNLFIKVAVFLLVVRVFLPFSALISNQLNDRLFYPQIAEHENALQPIVRSFEGLADFELPEKSGLGGFMMGPLFPVAPSIRMLAEKNEALNTAMREIVSQGLGVFKHLIAIMAIYLSLFVIQVIFLPIMMFWLINKLLFILFSYTIPQPWMHWHSKLGKEESNERRPQHG